MKIMLQLALRGAALAVGVAGCTLGPHFVRPESPQATGYSATPVAAVRYP
jgi:hypothetical protein